MTWADYIQSGKLEPDLSIRGQGLCGYSHVYMDKYHIYKSIHRAVGRQKSLLQVHLLSVNNLALISTFIWKSQEHNFLKRVII